MTMRAASLTLGALVVATVIAIDPVGLAPFGPARWMAVSTLALAGSGLAIWHGDVPFERLTARAGATMLAFLTAGALVGGDLPTSLLGHPERHLGLLTWLLVALVFAAGQQVRAVGDVEVIARAMVIATVVLGAWCTWELAAGPPIELGTSTARLVGPFGSAAFLGAALCLLLPVVVAVALDTATPAVWRITSGVAACGALVSVVGSGSRSAWIGLGAGAAVTIIRVRPAPRAVLGGAVVVLAAVAVLVPRLDQLVERSGGSASRLDEWRVAARVVSHHPVVGVGPEGYRIAVSEGIDARYERTYGRDRVLPDRAHSAPLDVALMGGIPAAIAAAVLVAMIGRRAVRLVGASRPVIAGISVSVISYAVQQLLLFPLAEIDPVWWLLAGIVVTASRGNVTGGSSMAARRAVAATALLLAPLALAAGVLDVAADRLARRSLDLADTDLTTAIETAARAVALRPDNVRYRMVAGELSARTGTLAGIDAARFQAERALAWSAGDPIAGDARATFLLERARITGEGSDVEAALSAWRTLVERDPVRARWQLQLGRAAALANDIELARQAWTTAADLAPNDPTAGRLLAALGTAGSTGNEPPEQ